MAITTDYPGIKVEVRVAEAVLQEYDDDEAESSTNAATKYIEATSGLTFDIRFEMTPKWPDNPVLFRTYVDGRHVRDRIAKQEDFRDDPDVRSAADQLMKDMKEMGEIEVHVFFVKNVRNSSKLELSAMSTSDFGNIPEKALKGRALSHQTILRAPEVIPKTTQLTCRYMNNDRKSFITFKFKYRSKAALQSLLIIPRNPSPVPLEDRDVDTLTLKESHEVLRRHREREDAAPSVKRERFKRERSSTAVMEDQDDGNVSFVSAKRRRLPITLNEDGIEIVDLTSATA
ncbi:hypothetical protein AA0121_g5095 [Alternaria tenuissima]|nr:hypothetical protein AA0121_g5095 [Alternaria tenuissima]